MSNPEKALFLKRYKRDRKDCMFKSLSDRELEIMSMHDDEHMDFPKIRIELNRIYGLSLTTDDVKEIHEGAQKKVISCLINLKGYTNEHFVDLQKIYDEMKADEYNIYFQRQYLEE